MEPYGGYKKKLGIKTWNIFNPKNTAPYSLSRSKIDLFVECPRCFYLDRRLGVSRPAGFPFNLNSAVDHLLKKEFDVHRKNKSVHPLMEAHGVVAVPFAHADIDIWRENFKGVEFVHKPTNLLIKGALDDIWVNKAGELHVVDYKATSKDTEVNLDAEWQDGYKRQVEVYLWLLRQNGFKVSDTAYFVYCNGKRDRDGFNARLDFDIKIIPYVGNDAWIEKTLPKIKACLVDERIPKSKDDCEYCAYVNNLRTVGQRLQAGKVEAVAEAKPMPVKKEKLKKSAKKKIVAKVDVNISDTLFDF
jgi:CRISPR/Cas system-associated exonuclease Cas4 (RecB family)